MTQLREVTSDGRLKLNFHPGQLRAWDSQKRIVAVVSGARGGKSSFGPHWLWREMQICGPGDYLVVAPSLQIIDKAAGPEIEEVFGRLFYAGTMHRSPMQLKISKNGEGALWNGEWNGVPIRRKSRILFGHADDPDSLESLTAKAVWCDEPGQKAFKQSSWEAVQRRVSIDRGRILMTTTPYVSGGWLRRLIFDPWQAARGNHPDIDFIRFSSDENPAFPKEEMERAKRDLPGWKYRMFFQASFERPAGLIYDVFDETIHVTPPFAMPPHWPRFVGLDFGGTNTAAVFIAQEYSDKPTGKLYVYKEYLHGGRTAKQHAEALLRAETKRPMCFGGSKSEGQWRKEFAEGGLPVREPPISRVERTRGEVEVGILRVYGSFKRNEVQVFSTCEGLLDELGSYSREVDDAGEPTEKIADKETFHRLDALRYVMAHLRGGMVAKAVRL